MLIKHLDSEIQFRGEQVAIKFFRKFYPCYIKNLKGCSEYRHKLVTEINYKNIISLLKELLNNASI